MDKSKYKHTSFGKKKISMRKKILIITASVFSCIAIICIAFYLFSKYVPTNADTNPNNLPSSTTCTSNKGGEVCENTIDYDKVIDEQNSKYDGYDDTLPSNDQLSECRNYLSEAECSAQGL